MTNKQFIKMGHSAFLIWITTLLGIYLIYQYGIIVIFCLGLLFCCLWGLLYSFVTVTYFINFLHFKNWVESTPLDIYLLLDNKESDSKHD
ncbi:hypothetical protein AsAng_0016080 [Aureispira anguillae]|uniref:Uncharacterized protein n=1 Tax=Aureispira anguillae TaxID=2864201 RepID=A0A915YD50_9BACT|nr:hypothetical protein AsAng_0016080 [Aureispira anguillae]